MKKILKMNVIITEMPPALTKSSLWELLSLGESIKILFFMKRERRIPVRMNVITPGNKKIT